MFEVLRLENVDIFYGHWVHFVFNWCFSLFRYHAPKKSGNPDVHVQLSKENPLQETKK
jgi:hypothetical protein